MSTITINQISLLLTWFFLTILVFLLALIARFYEKFSGETTYYKYYLVPVLLMGIATARYVSLDQWGGDIAGDIFLFGGGFALSGLCYHLYHQMTKGR
jgi:hypothetical protein